MDKPLQLKFELLERLITLFRRASEDGPDVLAQWVERAKREILMGQIGCSEEVADIYISAALDRR